MRPIAGDKLNKYVQDGTTMNIDARFRWNNIARILQVSSRTLHQRRHEIGMPVNGRQFSALTDDHLDNIVWGVLQCTPSVGFVPDLSFDVRSMQTTYLLATCSSACCTYICQNNSACCLVFFIICCTTFLLFS